MGTTWKTVSARIRGAKTELEDYDEETDGVVLSTAKLQELVKAIAGVDIMENETTFKDIYTIIDEIAQKWGDINDINRASLLEALAGKRNANALAAVLNNVETLEAAYQSAENSAGSAQREQAQYAKSIEFSLNRLKASGQELISDLIDSGFIKGLIDFGNGALNFFDAIIGKTKMFGSLIAGIVAFIIQSKVFDFKNGDSLFGFIKEARENKKSGLDVKAPQKMNAEEKVLAERLKNEETIKNSAIAAIKEVEAVAKGEDIKTETHEQMENHITAVKQQSENSETAAQERANNAKNAGASSGAGGSLKAFAGATFVSLLITAVTKIISVIGEAIDHAIVTAEEAKEASDNVADALSKVSQNASDANKVVKESGERFIQLQQGVDAFGHNMELSEDDFNEYVNLSEKFAELLPDLKTGVNDLGNPILKAVDSLSVFTDAINANAEAAARAALYTRDEENGNKTGLELTLQSFNQNVKDNSLAKMFNGELPFETIRDRILEGRRKGVPQDLVYGGLGLNWTQGNDLNNIVNLSEALKDIDEELATATGDRLEELRLQRKAKQKSIDDYWDNLRQAAEQVDVDNELEADKISGVVKNLRILEDGYSNFTSKQNEYINAYIDSLSAEQWKAFDTDKNGLKKSELQKAISDIEGLFQNNLFSGIVDQITSSSITKDNSTSEQYTEWINHITQDLAGVTDETGNALGEEFAQSFLEGMFGIKAMPIEDITAQGEKFLSSNGFITPQTIGGATAYDQSGISLLHMWSEKLTGAEKTAMRGWNDDLKNQFKDLIKQTDIAGLSADEAAEKYAELARQVSKSMKDATEDMKTTGSSMLKTLQSQMAPALNALGEAYNAIFNGGENGDEFNMAAVTIAQLESVRSAVESLTSNEEWGIKVDTADVDKLINILGDVNTTAEDAQQAFDDFATSIANAVLPNIENLTEASYQAGIQALQEMGIVNAEEVLISRIGLSLEEFKEAKEAANAAGINTDGDIKNLSDLNMADIEAQNSLAKLIAEKIRTNGVTIQTNGDIANLISLAQAAYGTAGALAEVYDEINRLNSKGDSATNQYEKEYWYAKANSLRENFNSPAWVQARMNELYQGAQVSVDFDGGNAANSAGSSGGSGGGGSDAANDFSEEIDWIERRQKALSDALTDIQGMVDFTYADWDTRLAHIGMKYQNLNDQITLSQQAMERYQRAMADVGLDEEYAAKVRAGIIDLETITDESLKNRIDAYQGYYDKYIQYEQQSNDLIRQHIALIQDEIDQIRGKFEDINEDLAHLNTLSDSYINRGTIYQQLGSLLDKRVHTEMQLENVLKEREAIEAKIAQYEGDTNSEGYHDLIKNLKDCDEQAEGFRDTLQEIAKTRFDTVAKQFDRIAESIDHATSRINSLADTAEAQGFYASDEFIKANLAMEEDRRSNLYKERAELEKALAEGVANGSITEGSDTWNEMNNQIEETTDNIYASTAAIEKYKDELRSWQWEAQDWIRERANRAHDTNDFMIEQLGTDKLFEKNGNWNDSATATQGLHVLNYSMYLDESRKLAEEIKKIDEEMANDPYDVRLIARKEELIDLQREAIRNANDEKEAIRSLVKEGYDTFLDYLQKAIDKRKEALEAEQTLYEYEKNVRDQAKQIASYQKQLASLSGDTSEENQLRVQQLNNSLAEAQEQLQETQYEKWVSDQEQMMDEMYNQFDELINERLDNLDRLVQDAVNTTDQNGTKIANTVSEKAEAIGVDIQSGFGGIDLRGAFEGVGTDISNQTSTLNNTLEIQGQAIIKAAQDAALSIKGEMTKLGTDDTNNARDDSGLEDTLKKLEEELNKSTTASGDMAYRMYNPNSGQHLITTNANEAADLEKLGWNREGATTFSFKEGKSVTRLYNPNNGDHLYTTSSGEIKTLKALGWNDEGEAFKTSDDGYDVYRLYNPNNGLHHFTTDAKERDYLKSLGWKDEGVAFRSVGKFAKGGTVGKAVKGTGEDGFILARTGEEVLSLDKIKGMQQVLTMFEPLTKLQQKIPNGISTLGGNNVTIGDVTTTLSLPNVTNYEDFVNKAKADPKFERLVQQMTIGNALGQSKLKKYSI